MPALAVSPPFAIFPDINGNPLDNGAIYIGVAGLPAATNPISVFFDEALSVPAAQPVTVKGGYPMNGSTRARLFVNSDYSIEVRNVNGTTVFSALESTDILSSDLITFIQAGSGAVQRTVQSKLRDVVSVKDFGAVGDGTTDDTVAIQAALTYCAASYRELFFPGGNYRVTSNITVPRTNNVQRGYRLSGEGKDHDTVITLDGAGITTGLTFSSSGAGVYQYWGVLSGIKFSCVNGAERAVTFTYAHAPYIVDCAFVGATKIGLLLDNSNQPVVEKCLFINNGNASNAQVKLDVCTAVGWRDNYIATGNSGVVAGLDVDRTNTGIFSGGAIESTGIPIRVCETADAVVGCQDLTFQSINLENPSTCYFRVGYGWAGAGQGVKNLSINGCRGYLSGSTTAAIAVDLKNCINAEIRQSQFALDNGKTCFFNLEGATNVAVFIGQQRPQFGVSTLWVRENGAHVVVASPQYDWSSAWPTDQIVYGSINGTTSTLDNRIFPTQGGLFNVLALTNGGATTINRTVAIPNVNGTRLTLFALDGNTTIAHLGGGGTGQFRNKSGANITLTTNQLLEYRYSAADGNWSQVA